MHDMTMEAPGLSRTTAATRRADTPPLVRWGARAAIAAPLLAVFSIAVGVPIFTADMREVAGGARWTLVTGASLALLLLLIVALLALYRVQEQRLGRLGHASALVALAGTVLAAGGAWDSVFTVPYLADVAPGVLDRATSGSLLAGYVSSYLVLVVGWAAFAVATLRARVLPRGPAIALLAGSVLAILPAPTAMRLLVVSVAVALLGRYSAAISHQ